MFLSSLTFLALVCLAQPEQTEATLGDVRRQAEAFVQEVVEVYQQVASQQPQVPAEGCGER